MPLVGYIGMRYIVSLKLSKIVNFFYFLTITSKWSYFCAWNFVLNVSNTQDVTSLKKFFGWQTKASHYDLCKGQANRSIVLRITTIWKLVEFITMLFLWEQVVYSSIQFSYGCNSKYNAMICLPFAQVLVRNGFFFVKSYVIPM